MIFQVAQIKAVFDSDLPKAVFDSDFHGFIFGALPLGDVLFLNVNMGNAGQWGLNKNGDMWIGIDSSGRIKLFWVELPLASSLKRIR